MNELSLQLKELEDCSFNREFLLWNIFVVFLMVAGAAIVLMTTWWKFFGSLLIGISLWGLWALGHEYIHYLREQDNRPFVFALASVTMAPTLYPFSTARYEHLKQHSYLNHIKRDSAWLLLDKDRFQSMNKFLRYFYAATRTYLWFLGPIIYCFNFHWKMSPPAKCKKSEHYISMTLVIAWSCVLVTTLIQISLVDGLFLIILPFIVFSSFMAFITLSTHNPSKYVDIKWYRDRSGVRKPLEHTVDLKIGPFVERICFYANIHSIHHISPKVPFYKYKKGRFLLQQAGVKNIREVNGYLHFQNIITNSHVFCTDKNGPISFDESRGQV